LVNGWLFRLLIGMKMLEIGRVNIFLVSSSSHMKQGVGNFFAIASGILISNHTVAKYTRDPHQIPTTPLPHK